MTACREARIRQLGALICNPEATRLWRIVCHAEHQVLHAMAAQESRA